MNERLTEGKKTKQQAVLSGNQVHLSGGAPWEVFRSQHLWKQNQIGMLRDTLKTLKKRF